MLYFFFLSIANHLIPFSVFSNNFPFEFPFGNAFFFTFLIGKSIFYFINFECFIIFNILLNKAIQAFNVFFQ